MNTTSPVPVPIPLDVHGDPECPESCSDVCPACKCRVCDEIASVEFDDERICGGCLPRIEERYRLRRRHFTAGERDAFAAHVRALAPRSMVTWLLEYQWAAVLACRSSEVAGLARQSGVLDYDGRLDFSPADIEKALAAGALCREVA